MAAMFRLIFILLMLNALGNLYGQSCPKKSHLDALEFVFFQPPPIDFQFEDSLNIMADEEILLDTLIDVSNSSDYIISWQIEVNGIFEQIPNHYQFIEDAVLLFSINSESTCDASDTIYVVVDETVSLDISKNDQIRLFPNPARNVLYVEFDSDATRHILKMITPLGHEIYQRDISCDIGSCMVEINLDHLPTGYYLVLIESRFAVKSAVFSLQH